MSTLLTVYAGLRSRAEALDVVANNLANQGSSGFKKKSIHFSTGAESIQQNHNPLARAINHPTVQPSNHPAIQQTTHLNGAGALLTGRSFSAVLQVGGFARLFRRARAGASSNAAR